MKDSNILGNIFAGIISLISIEMILIAMLFGYEVKIDCKKKEKCEGGTTEVG